MPRAAEARAWWADVEDVRERIERRRVREQRALGGAAGQARGVVAHAAHRGVREVRPSRRLMVVRSGVSRVGVSGAGGSTTRRRPRPRAVQRVGPRPDRIAAWAVVLGFVLVLVAVLSAHG